MKRLRFISLFVLLFGCATLTSCDDEAIDGDIAFTDGPVIDPTAAAFRADFNGGTWTAENTTVVISPTGIEIVAERGTAGEGFGFSLDGNTVGSYQANQNIVAFTPASSTFGYWGVNPTNPNENTGSVTITSINTVTQKISGFFSYKGYWSDSSVNNIPPIQFTNGVFNNLPYTTTGTNPNNDSFSTKINGTDFIDTEIDVATVNNVIQITAANAANEKVTIGVRDNVGAGTYSITGNVGTDMVQASYKPGIFHLQAYTGTVTILSKTATRIRGTFSFTTSDGPTIYQFTVGQFDVAY